MLAEVFTTTIASKFLAVEETSNHLDKIVVLELTFLIAILFGIIHIFYDLLHSFLYREERIAISFGGDMAISYIFLHLLPELEKGAEDFGTFFTLSPW